MLTQKTQIIVNTCKSCAYFNQSNEIANVGSCDLFSESVRSCDRACSSAVKVPALFDSYVDCDRVLKTHAGLALTVPSDYQYRPFEGDNIQELYLHMDQELARLREHANFIKVDANA